MAKTRWLTLLVAVAGLTAGDTSAQTPAARAPAAQTPTTGPASANVLFWSPGQREANFRRMAELAPHLPVSRGAGPIRALAPGRPLALDPTAFIEAEKVAGLLVIQDGAVRLERDGLDLKADEPWVSFSMTKSLTSTLVGAAIKDGHIQSLDDPITRYIPEMAGAGYDGVNLRQLLTMTSGVRWNEDYTDPSSDVARMLFTPADPGLDATVSYMRRLPRAVEPGARWTYSTGETNLVGVLLARATGKSLSAYLSEKVWSRAGMEHGAAWGPDQDGKEIGGCCVSATLRDWGRVGLMALEDGVVGGERITPDGWFAEAARKHAEIGAPGRGYGYQWWTWDDGRFGAQGIFGQAIHIDPRRRLVIVILSAWPTATGSARSAARAAFIDQVLAAADQ